MFSVSFDLLKPPAHSRNAFGANNGLELLNLKVLELWKVEGTDMIVGIQGEIRLDGNSDIFVAHAVG